MENKGEVNIKTIDCVQNMGSFELNEAEDEK
jgi:CDP-diacylglycerol--inositol 3-phosphatidyltransferase